MTQAKRKSNLLLLAVLLFSGVMALAGVSPAFAVTSDKTVDISSPTYTKYYMIIPTKNLTAFFVQNGKDGIGLKTFSRSDQLVTVNVVFNNVTYTDPENSVTSKVMVSKATTLNLPGHMTTGYEIHFKEDLKINIRESYYNYFAHLYGDGAITLDPQVTFIALFDGGNEPHTLSTKYSYWGTVSPVFSIPGIQFRSENVPTDPNDPESPDFDLGDNGGVLIPEPEDNRSLLNKFYDWLSEVFNWKLSYSGFLVLFWSVVGVIGLSILMPLMRRIFG